MKIYSRIENLVMTLVAAALFMVGCNDSDKVFNDSDNSIDPNDQIEASGSGYVSFSDFVLSVDVEEEVFTTKSTESDIDVSEYVVTITNKTSGEVAYEKSYAEACAEEELLKLTSGGYYLVVASSKEIPAVAWGERVYSSDEISLTVGDDNVTKVGTVVCRLATIKSQVSISADMLSLFKTDDVQDPFLVTLEYGDAELVYTTDKLYSEDATEAQTEANSGYFAPQDGESVIMVTITGLYDTSSAADEASYTPITWSQSISGVAAGQSRMISVKIDNFEDGTVEISFEVQEWIYDEPLGVDIFSPSFAIAMGESEIFEPDDSLGGNDVGSAVLTRLDGEDTTTPYLITEDTFDELFETYSPQYGVSLAPESGVSMESVMVEVDSSSSTLMAALAAAGYVDNQIYLLESGVVVDGFGDYINVVNSSSTGVVSVALKYLAIRSLYDFVGEHTFTVVAVDGLGRCSSTPLYFESCGSMDVAYPTIEWEGGDFSLTHTISVVESENPTIEFSVDSPNGVKSMSISINSEVLTETELSQLGLSQNMDLANPATDYMAGMLSELGFPVGDEIIGQTHLEFDITSFMPLLAQVHVGMRPDIEAAYTDFVITVVDASGGESSETLKVVSYYYGD